MPGDLQIMPYILLSQQIPNAAPSVEVILIIPDAVPAFQLEH